MKGRYLGGWWTVFFNWKFVEEKKKNVLNYCQLWKIKNCQGVLMSKIKNTPPLPFGHWICMSISAVCEFSSPTKLCKKIFNSLPFWLHFRSPCWRKRKNKVTFCGTRIENELFLDSCFARDLAGVENMGRKRKGFAIFTLTNNDKNPIGRYMSFDILTETSAANTDGLTHTQLLNRSYFS